MLSADRPGAPASSRADEPVRPHRDRQRLRRHHGRRAGGPGRQARADDRSRRLGRARPAQLDRRGFSEKTPCYNRDTPFDVAAGGYSAPRSARTPASAARRCSTAAWPCACARPTSCPTRTSTRTPAPPGRIATRSSSRSTRRPKRCFRSRARPARIRRNRRARRRIPQAPAPLAPDLAAHGGRGARPGPASVPVAAGHQLRTAEQRARLPRLRHLRRVCLRGSSQERSVHRAHPAPATEPDSISVTNTTAVRLEHAGRTRDAVVCMRPRRSAAVRFSGAVGSRSRPARSRPPRLLLASGLDQRQSRGPCDRPLPDAALQRGGHGHVQRAAGAEPRVPQADRDPRLLLRPSVGGQTARAARVPAAVRDARAGARPRASLPFGLGSSSRPSCSRTTGFIVMAEDRPRADNRVALRAGDGRHSMTPARHASSHDYDARDLAARDALARAARRILRARRRARPMPHIRSRRSRTRSAPCGSGTIPHDVAAGRLGRVPRSEQSVRHRRAAPCLARPA